MNPKPRKNHVKMIAILVAAFVFLAVITGFCWLQLSRKFPIEIAANLPRQDVSATNFNLPTTGEVALGIINGDKVDCKALTNDAPRPTASVIKLLTALVTIEKSPSLDRTITLTNDDAVIFNNTVVAGGSNVPIVAGEVLSEKQLLQALLIASADNVADSIVNHIFGNFANYKIAAENFLRANDLENTTIGADGSGLDAGTTSSPTDLCKITFLATQNPELLAIMRMKELADFPVAGTLDNTNQSLGKSGIFAGKTGFINEAGYNLAAAFSIGEQKFISVVLGQATENARFSVTEKLADSTEANVKLRQISAGQKVGTARSASGDTIDLVAKSDLATTTFSDARADFVVKLSDKTGEINDGEVVGTIKLGDKSTEIVAAKTLRDPDIFYKLTHF